MPTIKEVSRRARVSPATVSRVLNDTAPVNKHTRQRVLDVINELGYQPNAFARGLVTNRSGGIGVVVNEISSPFYAGMVGGIEKVIETAGAHLLVSSGHAYRQTELEALEFLRAQRSDALIFQSDASTDADIIEWHRGVDVPTIIFGRFIAELSESCIYLDNELGGFLAVQHLLECGHTEIAFISGPPIIKDSWERQHGYRRALQNADIGYDEMLVVEGDFTEESGYQATRRLLERQQSFTALFVANDQMAAGAFQALREAQLDIPQDISVIGYDDVLFARYLYPALTTVRQPFDAMGQAAATLALAAIDGEETEVKRRFDPELIVRDSVKRIA